MQNVLHVSFSFPPSSLFLFSFLTKAASSRWIGRDQGVIRWWVDGAATLSLLCVEALDKCQGYLRKQESHAGF